MWLENRNGEGSFITNWIKTKELDSINININASNIIFSYHPKDFSLPILSHITLSSAGAENRVWGADPRLVMVRCWYDWLRMVTWQLCSNVLFLCLLSAYYCQLWWPARSITASLFPLIAPWLSPVSASSLGTICQTTSQHCKHSSDTTFSCEKGNMECQCNINSLGEL